MNYKKKIAVVTATRAEYGPLKNTIKRISQDDELELLLWVTGSHLSDRYGRTISEIKEDGFLIDEEVPIIPEADEKAENEVLKTLSNASEKFGRLMLEKKPDLLLVVGDRYELLPICSAAVVLNIPIAHISGGEITEGAIDDTVRHSITKMSALHFPACEEYRKRIIQMGEEPSLVFNYGDIGIENIKKTELMTKEQLYRNMREDLDIDLKDNQEFSLVTYHPVTTEAGNAKDQAVNLFETFKLYKDMCFIVTKANADLEGQIINEVAEEYANRCDNIFLVASLGARRYLSALSMCQMVIGNSSSGIIEAPAFGVPTVNVGNRQKGRIRASSIIDCDNSIEAIKLAIDKALTSEFRAIAKNTINPYGDGETSEGIVREIKKYLFGDAEKLKKFYDIKFDV